jgi:hypothetical protein
VAENNRVVGYQVGVSGRDGVEHRTGVEIFGVCSEDVARMTTVALTEEKSGGAVSAGVVRFEDIKEIGDEGVVAPLVVEVP